MKIHAYLLCFNEEPIIRHTLEHYLGFCSRVFVMDNMSTDRSAAIARTYDQVRVIPWDSNGTFDRPMATRMRSQTFKQYSRQGGCHTEEVADWIITPDMDELIYHPEIRNVLIEYQHASVTVPQITGFEVVSAREITPSQPLLQQFRRGYRSLSMDKRILFSTNFDMTFSHGCHPRGPGFEYMKSTHGYRPSNKHPIALLHYKHLGSRYYQSAVKNGARAPAGSVTRSQDGKYHGVGCHFAKIVEQEIRRSPLIGQAIPLFDSQGHVRFKAFQDTCGEAGFPFHTTVMLPDRDIELIRDVAIDLENRDLTTSLRLMEIAKAACPSGPLIRNKVNEYRQKLLKE